LGQIALKSSSQAKNGNEKDQQNANGAVARQRIALGTTMVSLGRQQSSQV
jgi:hypothetical protein